MKNTRQMKYHQNALLVLLFLIFHTTLATAQIGNVIWEDNFDRFDTAIWNPIEGNGCEIGLCGWGNQELEYYHGNNITIEAVPGEPGNTALVLEAKRETIGTNQFTSGKVDTENNLSIHYGLIEVRMRAPRVETGLWPAAWLLGTSNVTWPAKGEIDMMEMGHSVEERDRLGFPGSDINSYVGANAIFATEDGGVGSIAYDVDYNTPYLASSSLADRFVTYRLYWEPTQLRLTVVDGDTEHDFYGGPLPIDPNGVTGAFSKPFYMLLNLAVGGNFTDAAIPGEVTAALPSKLYIDYVRVSEWNGYGEVTTDYGGLTAERGPFGVFTENTPTASALSYGLDAEIFVWGGTMQEGNTEAAEGSEVIAWETLEANSWFGGGISALFGRDMSGYVSGGSLKFKIKIPEDVSFRIGITDNFTNEEWITFPAGETKYGLTRDGEWGQVEIPLVDFSGLLAFQNINYMFAIASLDGAFPSSTVQIGIDDIIWDDGTGIPTTIAVTGVQVSPASATLSLGDTQQLNAQVSPANATNTNIIWSTSTSSVASVDTNGIVTAHAVGSATITGTTADGAFTASSVITVQENTVDEPDFVPDFTKQYYINNPHHNLRIGASGTEDPFTRPTSDTTDQVKWKFTASPTAGYYYIDCVGGGAKPRLRSDRSVFTDMQRTSSGGSWVRWSITAAGDDKYLLTTLGNTLNRLQVDASGTLKMVSSASTGTWEQFTFTEASTDTQGPGTTSLRIEAEDYNGMNGVQTETTTDIGGGLNVGYIDAGDWIEYVVTIPSSGSYTMNFRVASVPGSAAAQIQVDGSVLTTVNIAPTGGWQSWVTLSKTVNLSAGTQTIRLYSPAQNWNLNWFDIETVGGAKATETTPTASIKDRITLYPIPVNEVLNINVIDPQNYVSFEIIDITGKVILKQRDITTTTTSLSIDEISQGMYFLRATKIDASHTIKQFMK